MQMNSAIKNEILFAHRRGASMDAIAKSFGYTAKEIERVVFPNGKESKQLPVVIHRKRPDRPQEIDIDPATLQKPVDQKEKWSNAGKKAWITRQQNKLKEQQRILPPAAVDQPIALEVSHLLTIHQKDKEEAMKLIGEALEYIKVGLDSINKAVELLNK
jgi:hypothetical protein